MARLGDKVTACGRSFHTVRPGRQSSSDVSAERRGRRLAQPSSGICERHTMKLIYWQVFMVYDRDDGMKISLASDTMLFALCAVCV